MIKAIIGLDYEVLYNFNIIVIGAVSPLFVVVAILYLASYKTIYQRVEKNVPNEHNFFL